MAWPITGISKVNVFCVLKIKSIKQKKKTTTKSALFFAL